MLSHSTTAITIADGEITVDAERLAPKLGLTVAALKAQMRNGNVSSVAETGINEDAGRTRVTFRYRKRAWSVVVDPDGTLVGRLSIMLVESRAPAAKAPPANTGDHQMSEAATNAFAANGKLIPLINFATSSGMHIASP